MDFHSQPGWMLPTFVDSSENLSLGIRTRGGFIDVPNLFGVPEDQLLGMINNSPDVAFERKSTPGIKVYTRGVLIQLDLGARFGINRIRFYPRNTVHPSPENPFEFDFLRSYQLSINDGTPETQTNAGTPIFSVVKTEENNEDAVSDVRFDLQYVRHVELKSLTTVNFEVDEIEIYGQGYVPESRYLSDIIDLGKPAVFGKLYWSGKTIGDPHKSQIIVRTRVGKDATPFVYYRIVEGREGETPLSASGAPLTREEYENLTPPYERQGSIKDDSEHWSSWSAPYPDAGGEGGTPIAFAELRRFIQFEVTFKSDLFSARALDFLGFEYLTPPLATAIIAEIFPREAQPAETIPFTYSVQTRIQEGLDAGFDRFQITTPARITSVESIQLIDAQ